MSQLTTILYLLGILFLHWVGDGVLQTDKMAKGKSKNMQNLIEHTGMYSGVFAFASIIYVAATGNILMVMFAPVTFLLHTITDFFTSRLNAKLWAKGDVHNFFVSVLFDQFLHFTQLFLTFYYLN